MLPVELMLPVPMLPMLSRACVSFEEESAEGVGTVISSAASRVGSFGLVPQADKSPLKKTTQPILTNSDKYITVLPYSYAALSKTKARVRLSLSTDADRNHSHFGNDR
jgi:hypothetical protein